MGVWYVYNTSAAENCCQNQPSKPNQTEPKQGPNDVNIRPACARVRVKPFELIRTQPIEKQIPNKQNKPEFHPSQSHNSQVNATDTSRSDSWLANPWANLHRAHRAHSPQYPTHPSVIQGSRAGIGEAENTLGWGLVRPRSAKNERNASRAAWYQVVTYNRNRNRDRPRCSNEQDAKGRVKKNAK